MHYGPSGPAADLEDRGGHESLRAVATRASLPTWRTGPAPAHPEPETPAWKAPACRAAGRRREPMRHRARRVQGAGHGTLRAVARRARLPTWRTGPAPAHPEPETPARRL